MIRTYIVRLKTTKRQATTLADLCEHLCVLYNSALEWRKNSWEKEAKSINYADQQRALALFRQSSPAVESYPSPIQRSPLRRIDRAFKAFFRRVKTGEKPGYPRFKARNQYDSFDVDGRNFRMEDGSIIITKLGGFRFKTSCHIKGEPRSMVVSRRGKHWIANIACYMGEAPEKIAVRKATGIDLGLTTLATLSDGTEIHNPRWTKREEDRLATANRSLSRKVKGSKNRTKAKERLRRVHQRIVGLRASYLTGVAKQLVGEYDLIAHEKLNIKGMAQSRFAKSIMDAAWNQLIQRLNCEAEYAGKHVVAVDPRGTTQKCSGCGQKVPKKLWNRSHDCPNCGLSLGRDHNAALNILGLGESLVERQNLCMIP